MKQEIISKAAQGLLMLGLLGISLPSSADPYPFKLDFEKDGRHTAVLASNPGLFPIEVSLRLKNSHNIAVEPAAPVKTVVPPQSTVTIAAIRPDVGGKPWSYDYDYTWWSGQPNIKPDPNAVYHLPFADGQSYRITQAHGGPVISHNTPATAYAVDIAMPEGAPILAARDGVVVETQDGFGEGRDDKSFIDKANFVRIMHSDGTWAEYFHMLKGSVAVHPGEYVKAGTMIGRAGNSGFSDGSHLHFGVQMNDGTQVVSIPFKFYTPTLGAFTPTMGEVLVADQRGTPPAGNAIATGGSSTAHGASQPAHGTGQSQ